MLGGKIVGGDGAVIEGADGALVDGKLADGGERVELGSINVVVLVWHEVKLIVLMAELVMTPVVEELEVTDEALVSLLVMGAELD